MRRSRRSVFLSAAMPSAAVLTVAIAACGSPGGGVGGDGDAADAPGPPPAATDSDAGHGAVEGAAEVAEPQLHLVSIAASGEVGMLDLLDESATRLGSVDAPQAVTSDGRYAFVDTGAGVDIVDTGVWTWDHADHFHYYRAEPRILAANEEGGAGPTAREGESDGEGVDVAAAAVPGEGEAIVSTSANSTSGGTGVFFPRSGEVVLLDNDALSEGRVAEVFRVEGAPHQGMVIPLGTGALVTAADAAGPGASQPATQLATRVTYHGPDGRPVDDASAPCADARGSITTRVGAVIGCADGALLVTLDGDTPRFERIPYPDGASAPRATGFANRKGRPVVAAPAGDVGFWTLDTRAREWDLVATDVPLVRVSAAGDDDDNVVAVDLSGRVLVYEAGSGTERVTPEVSLAEAVADPAALAGIDLTVDRERAYVNDPVAGLVHEIDYRGTPRVARSLATPTAPDFVAETGR